jgi:3-carboxy-cis,cis-muconate cycloisomerase
MPQKRNPIGCATILAAAVRAPGLAATMLSSMAQEHERGLGGWQAEWTVLPELISVAHGAFVHAAFIVDGLEVDANRMARNIVATNGRIFAEAVSFALRARVGRARASEIIGRALGRVNKEITLRAALDSDAAMAAVFSGDEIDALFDVSRHLGLAEETARRVAVAARQSVASVATPR